MHPAAPDPPSARPDWLHLWQILFTRPQSQMQSRPYLQLCLPRCALASRLAQAALQLLDALLQSGTPAACTLQRLPCLLGGLAGCCSCPRLPLVGAVCAVQRSPAAARSADIMLQQLEPMRTPLTARPCRCELLHCLSGTESGLASAAAATDDPAAAYCTSCI